MKLLRLGAACLLSMAVSGLFAHEEVDAILADLISGIAPDELAEPDSTRWPETVSEAADMAEELGLDAVGQAHLRLAAAEAWIAVGDGEQGEARAAAVLATAPSDETVRQRAGLALVAAWRQQVDAVVAQDAEPADADLPAIGDPLEQLAAYGDFGPLVRGRALAVAGLLALEDSGEDQNQALAAFDQALMVLAEQAPEHRVPLFTLRIMAMERAGADGEAIKQWLVGHQDDPALTQLGDSIFTAEQQMVGRPAPPLAAPRRDGVAGEARLADYQGTPVLLYFSASWSQRAQEITPLVVEAAANHDQIQALEVSFDTRDTLAKLEAYRARFAIAHPIIGEGLGWDGEIDDVWNITSIPTLLLIRADGSVGSENLVADELAQTRANLAKALATVAGNDQAEAEGEE